jgi:hypothetical protein
VLKGLNTKLERMRGNFLTDMSPHVRTLYEAYTEAQADETAGRALPRDPELPGLHWHTMRRGDAGHFAEVKDGPREDY